MIVEENPTLLLSLKSVMMAIELMDGDVKRIVWELSKGGIVLTTLQLIVSRF